MPDALSAQEILQIHDELVSMFADDGDPIDPPGPRDVNLVHSAAMRPMTSLGSVEKYEAIEEKAAALFHSLVSNHPFHNGNKRTALASLLVFLDANNRRLDATDDDLFSFVLAVAAHEEPFGGDADAVVTEIAAWLRHHSRAGAEQPRSMDTPDFLASCQKAGARVRESAKGESWVVIGPNRYSLRFSRSTRHLDGPVVRRYLNLLGLSEGKTGIHADEFEAGLNANQRLIRLYRSVLKRLAHT